MYEHPLTSVLIVDDNGNTYLEPLISYLKHIPHVKLTALHQLPEVLFEQDVVITARSSLGIGEVNLLSAF